MCFRDSTFIMFASAWLKAEKSDFSSLFAGAIHAVVFRNVLCQTPSNSVSNRVLYFALPSAFRVPRLSQHTIARPA
jgi:hypothetical protein